MFSIRTLAARRTPVVFTQRAAFSQSIARTAGKESALRTSTIRLNVVSIGPQASAARS
jgi:hypothetical protein